MRVHLLLSSLLAAGLLLVACGGDGDDTPGERVTDPAKVPTSTPIQNATLYQLRGGELVTQSGSTTVAGATKTAGPRAYTVVSGDTCSGIATKLAVSVDELLKANRTINADCTNLHAGDVLKVPGATGTTGGASSTPTPRPGSQRTYTVKAGDTCSGIAGSFTVALADLIRVNGLDADCRSLQPGQVLRIP